MGIHLKCKIRLILFVLLCFPFVVNAQDQEIYDLFESQIELWFKIPRDIVQVLYPNSVKVTPGIILEPWQVVSPPHNVSWNADPTYNYTLALVDVTSPDIQILHWLVVNICGNDFKHGRVFARYLPPQPLGMNSKIFSFVVYRQKREDRLKKKTKSKRPLTRKDFDIQHFAEVYGFGNPVAYTSFQILLASSSYSK